MQNEPISEQFCSVTPSKAGVQNTLKRLDSGFCRNDAEGLLQLAKMIVFLRSPFLREKISL
jgi:hypothetical protein